MLLQNLWTQQIEIFIGITPSKFFGYSSKALEINIAVPEDYSLHDGLQQSCFPTFSRLRSSL